MEATARGLQGLRPATFLWPRDLELNLQIVTEGISLPNYSSVLRPKFPHGIPFMETPCLSQKCYGEQAV